MTLTKFFIPAIISATIVGCATSVQAKDIDNLVFNPIGAKQTAMTMPSGESVRYIAYENIFYELV